jgi:hypothetical protein
MQDRRIMIQDAWLVRKEIVWMEWIDHYWNIYISICSKTSYIKF